MSTKSLPAVLCACVALALGASSASAQVLFSEKFDNNAAGWTMTGDWAIGATSVGASSLTGCGNPDPDFDASGDLNGGVAGTVLGGDIIPTPVPQGPFYLTSPVIDASGQARLMLEFMRWLNADYMPFMATTVEVFDGANWIGLVNYGTPGVVISDNAWTLHQFDISAYANANLQVRFGWTSLATGVFTTCAGWNVDNVKILNQGAFYDRFDNNAAGWGLGTDWQIGAATPSSGEGYGGPDPDRDADGTLGGGLAGVVIGGNAPTGLHGFYYLTSPVIDTTGMAKPMLALDRFLNSDYTPYMQNRIDVWDGSAWQNLFLTGGAPGVQDSSWVHLNYDVCQHSNANFQIRIGFNIDSSGVYLVSSWNVDNVVVYDDNSVPMALGQPSSPGGALDVNGVAVSRNGNPVNSGDVGPYYACIPANGPMNVTSLGNSGNLPWVLLLGNLDVNVNPIGAFGQLDIGTPGLGGITIVGSGIDPGFNNAFYFTDPSGQGFANWYVPVYLGGAVFTLQGVMVDPAVQIVPTNAVEISIAG